MMRGKRFYVLIAIGCLAVLSCCASFLMKSKYGPQPTCISGCFERGVITDRHSVLLAYNGNIQRDTLNHFVRKYQANAAAQVLGYISKASQEDIANNEQVQVGEYIGKSGVERSYESILCGRGGTGKNIKLTIDSELQRFGEELMEGSDGAIVALEPSSGEVLCMVSSPFYAPRALSGDSLYHNYLALCHDASKPLLNRCIQSQYIPGGVFKVAQGLVLLSEGVINENTTYPCERGFRKDGTEIGCYGHAYPLSLSRALSTACNGFFCYGFLEMMNDKKYGSVQNVLNKWNEYMTSMGFGDRLGIDLPNEKRGLLPNSGYYDKAFHQNWNGMTILENANGQGEIRATPLQLANLCATIANRGYYYTPHVVKEILGGNLENTYSTLHRTIVTESAYNTVVRGMRMSVLGGTSRVLASLPIEACGLSDTAHDKDASHAVFIGFAPFDSPKIAVAVYIENGGWGAKYAAPIGGYILEKYINGELSDTSKKGVKRIKEQIIVYEK